MADMYKALLLPLLVCCINFPLQAQSTTKLDGVWEGTITLGGIHTTKGYPLELVLTKKGKSINGRAYIHLSADEVVAMDVRGYIYYDQSIYLNDFQLIGDADNSVLPEFYRKYQLIWKRGLYEASLNGYWQEIKDESFANDRRQGRIFLRKAPPKPGKA